MNHARREINIAAGDLYPKTKRIDMTEYWKVYWREKETVPLEKRREFDDEEFAEELALYRTLDISESIYSDDLIIRMFVERTSLNVYDIRKR